MTGDRNHIKMNHANLCKLSNRAVYRLLCRLFPECTLFDISVGWRINKDFILKARGVRGDVIVSWKQEGGENSVKTLATSWQTR